MSLSSTVRHPSDPTAVPSNRPKKKAAATANGKGRCRTESAAEPSPDCTWSGVTPRTLDADVVGLVLQLIRVPGDCLPDALLDIGLLGQGLDGVGQLQPILLYGLADFAWVLSHSTSSFVLSTASAGMGGVASLI